MWYARPIPVAIGEAVDGGVCTAGSSSCCLLMRHGNNAAVLVHFGIGRSEADHAARIAGDYQSSDWPLRYRNARAAVNSWSSSWPPSAQCRK
jgi:hypothetical protein